MAINKISKEIVEAMLRKTAYSLPDSPSAAGIKAPDIKAALYRSQVDADISLVAEINRIVDELNATLDDIQSGEVGHATDYNNPHKVTKDQLELGNVDNTSDLDKPLSVAQRNYIDIVDAKANLHRDATNNPHWVTKSQVGLGNVNNTSDEDKPVSKAQQDALDKKINIEDIVDDLVSEDKDKPLSARAGNELKKAIPSAYGKAISIDYTPTNGNLTINLKDQSGNLLSSETVDLPLEQVLAAGGSYQENGILYLKLANNQFVEIDIGGALSRLTGDGSSINVTNGVISLSSEYKNKISDAETARHAHSNLELLETYTVDNMSLVEAAKNSHAHLNGKILANTSAVFTLELKNNIDALMQEALPITEEVVISSADWIGSKCVKSVACAKVANNIFVSPAPSDLLDYASAQIRAISQASGSLTFECESTPTKDLSIQVVAWG